MAKDIPRKKASPGLVSKTLWLALTYTARINLTHEFRSKLNLQKGSATGDVINPKLSVGYGTKRGPWRGNLITAS